MFSLGKTKGSAVAVDGLIGNAGFACWLDVNTPQ